MEAPQLEAVKQQFINEEVIIITAGKSWGQPYSCEQWATNFGLTILRFSNVKLSIPLATEPKFSGSCVFTKTISSVFFIYKFF